MKNKFYYLLPIGLIATASCSNSESKSSALIGKKPNILFIYADDIGYGDLACYGSGVVPTPNTDRLATEGIRFTDAHCGAATSTPSRYAMLTGEYAWRRKGTGIAAGDAAMVITPERYTLADMLSEAGYNTAVVGKWHLGLGDKMGEQDWNSVVKPNPSDIGFDYSYIMAATGDRTPCIFMENGRGVGLEKDDPVYVSYTQNFEGEPTGKENPEMLKLHPSHGHDQALINGVSRIGYMKGGVNARWEDENIADSITTNAIRFLEKQQNSDKPFFLYLATNDIHVPRVPHAMFAGKSGLGARGDALLSFDWTVGEVMAALKRLGMDENTLVILSSDNGAVIDDGYKDMAVELLGDHKPTGVYRGGKYSIFEGGTRVPCIVRWKGKVQPAVSNSLMSQIDWFASLATLVEATLPTDAAPDSESHLDSWLFANEQGRTYLVEQNLQNNLALTDGIWKYIPAAKGAAMNVQTNTELGNNSQENQLYNLTTDPGEQSNIASQHPDMVTEMDAILTTIKDK